MLYDTVGICTGVRAGDPRDFENLYRFVRQITWGTLCLRVSFTQDPQSPEDCLHDIYLILVDRIQSGKVKEFERLAGYVRCIMQSVIAAIHRGRSREQKTLGCIAGPRCQSALQEKHVYATEQKHVLRLSMNRLKPTQREILTRLYLHGEKKPQICREMNLSSDRYLYQKHAAKQKLAWFVDRKLAA